MKAFVKTDVGKARDMNEDFYYVADNDELKLYILADGMGGYNGGEIASKLATNSVKGYIETNFSQIPHDKESILKLIENAIEYANMVVYEKAKETERTRKYGYYFRSVLNI
jgi:protein phosphatase